MRAGWPIACTPRGPRCPSRVAARVQRSLLSEIFHRSVTQHLVRHAGNISVQVVAGDVTAGADDGGDRVATLPRRKTFDVGAYAWATLTATIALGIALLLDRYLGISNVALVFLTAVLAAAIAHGVWPALYACVISTLAYNFFFLPPLYTFTVADPPIPKTWWRCSSLPSLP
jgi:two-component system sensor histidine kinase KdpD